MREAARAGIEAHAVARAALLAAAMALAAACGTLKKPAAPGGYYEDDGPPAQVPEGVGEAPDAVPKDEPYHRYANRPYTVFGKTYVPVVNKEPMKQRGLASWYGRKFHGQKTSSGEIYDMYAMTAAHKTLPIPSYAKVTNLRNGKSVVVRINDRGPFHSDRIIDLSYAAAKRIGILATGSGMVEVERVFPGTPASPPVEASAAPSPVAANIETPMVSQEKTGMWLQLGAFASADAAQQFRERVSRDLPWMMEPVEVMSRDGLYRVRLGPYRSLQEAAAIGDKVRQSLGYAPVLMER